MSEYSESQVNENTRFSDAVGKWLGGAGIVVGLIAFAWQPIVMSIISVVLGILATQSPQKTLGWVSVVIGAIAFIIGVV